MTKTIPKGACQGKQRADATSADAHRSGKQSTRPESRLKQVQSAVGNQGLLKMLSDGSLQRRLATNSRRAVRQQNTDPLAAMATHRPETAPAKQQATALRAATLRRCSCGKSSSSSGECEECKAKSMQRKETGAGPSQPVAGGTAAPPIVHEVLRSSGQPLDAATRSFMEARFGHDLANIRVHTDDHAAESAHAVNALAYTVGRDVVFGAGQYAPQTQAGARLLAHELAHTIQNPEPGGFFPFLEVGRVDDPAERAADQSADAVMRGDKVSLAPAAGSALRRQARTCTATTASRPDQRIVHCDDGDYRVTLTSTTEPRRPETRTSVSAGWNDTDIFMTVEICRGRTSVQITPSVDLPSAVQQAIGNVLSGSGVLSGVTITPELRITVHQSNSFTLTLAPGVTVDPSTGRVTGESLGATVETPDVTGSVSLSHSETTGAIGLNLTITPGAPQRRTDCTGKPQRRLVFNCERISHIAPVPEVPRRTVPEEQVRYIFFEYPTANIRRNFRLPTDIQDLYAQGYRVQSIRGFTSPEGPRPRETRSFEGNIALGQERADAALTWLRTEACPTCDFSGVTPEGRSELPPALGAVEPEPRGRAMERPAVEEFLASDPLAPQDPAAVAAFRRLPRQQQRNQAFELMRRAEIVFHRDREVQAYRAAVPGRDEYSPVDCPADVIEAARASFGINVATGAIPRR